jgi:hypothetical protein
MKTRHLLALAALIIIAGCVSQKKRALATHLDFKGTPICGELESFALPGCIESAATEEFERAFMMKDNHMVYVNTYGEEKKVYHLVDEFPHSTDWEKVKWQYWVTKDSLSKIYIVDTTMEVKSYGNLRGAYSTVFKTEPDKGSIILRILSNSIYISEGEAAVVVQYFDREGDDWVKANNK